MIAHKVSRIKSYVTDAIEDLEWRAERAEELDFMEGPNVTTRQAKVAAYRKAAREMLTMLVKFELSSLVIQS